VAENLLHHFRGIKGYAFLIWMIAGFASLVIFIVARLASTAGLGEFAQIGNVLLVLVWFIAGYLAVGRFMAVEGRKPKFRDANGVGLWSIVTFFIVVLILVAIMLFFVVFGLLSGAEGGGGQGGGRGGAPGGEGNNPFEDPAKLLIPVIGFFGTLTWFYLVPMLSFMFFSLFQKPPAAEQVRA